ncbi:alpha/beta hydrolase [Gordonia sp. TBRC 11910]|uniref:Alpha/beta hydrolase n=1 Tax=Gordonia asplenii TaxID=2725283 RepID=A0A848KZM9_9ACTN|nr:alpha/beta hydrolase family protein [Gordonia asplenii]NMO03672.1 alpha/beta hydrolase [Gordonia asplenii]
MNHQVIDADGVAIATTLLRPAAADSRSPLLVTLHGGTYTSGYYDVAGSPAGSFNEVATRNGFAVLAVDRPGYGGSSVLPEQTNTFARQAEILDVAIGKALADHGPGDVVLVAHSIGGMIALEIAARRPAWRLVGVSATGMGARIPAGGASEQLGGLGLSGIVELPAEQREAIMFGPPGTYSPEALIAARNSYAPTPFIELTEAPRWARERLAAVAAQVAVPVHNALAEHDALWDTTPEALAAFADAFAGRATVELVPGVGHSIDHHLRSTETHLRQLAFALSCSARAAAA